MRSSLTSGSGCQGHAARLIGYSVGVCRSAPDIAPGARRLTLRQSGKHMEYAMKTTAAQKELMTDFDLAQQAFNASHVRLQQSLRATEQGELPVQTLRE